MKEVLAHWLWYCNTSIKVKPDLFSQKQMQQSNSEVSKQERTSFHRFAIDTDEELVPIPNAIIKCICTIFFVFTLHGSYSSCMTCTLAPAVVTECPLVSTVQILAALLNLVFDVSPNVISTFLWINDQRNMVWFEILPFHVRFQEVLIFADSH